MALPETQTSPTPGTAPGLTPGTRGPGTHDSGLAQPRPLRRRRGFLTHGRPGWVPAAAARFSYTYGLGGAAVLLTLTLAITGVPLLFHYQPGPDAYRSVAALTYALPYGGLFRALHFWAAQLLVVVAFLHLLRVALTHAYRSPRATNWLIGLGLLALAVVLDYTGYLLRGDLEAISAATVGQRLLESVPLLGKTLGALVFGAGGAAALLQLNAWHSFLLAGLVFGLIGWHLWRIRRDGGISRPQVAAAPRIETPAATAGVEAPAAAGRQGAEQHIPLSQLAAREWVAGLAWANGLLLLALLRPPGLGLPPDAAVPGHIRAPWVFGAVQVLLPHFSPLLAGVLIPLAAIGLLAWAPYLAKSRPAAGRWLVTFVLSLFAALTLYFWWRG